MGVLSILFWLQIQNIALYQLLWRKLILFQPKLVHWEYGVSSHLPALYPSDFIETAFTNIPDNYLCRAWLETFNTPKTLVMISWSVHWDMRKLRVPCACASGFDVWMITNITLRSFSGWKHRDTQWYVFSSCI